MGFFVFIPFAEGADMREEIKHLWGVNECAQALGLSIATIYAFVHQNRIPYIKLGRALRFHPDRIREWIEARTREPQSRGH